jgi:hypothetical protein
VLIILTAILVVIGLLGVLTPMVAARVKKRGRRLLCEVVSVETIGITGFDLQSEDLGEPILEYENERIPVTRVSVMRVVLTNNGGVPIRYERDVVVPLALELLDESAKVLKANVVHRNHDFVFTVERPEKEPKRVVCRFDLLNQGDQVELKLLCVDNQSGDLRIHGRVEGVKEIEKVHWKTVASSRAKWFRVLFSIYGVGGLVAGLLIYFLGSNTPLGSVSEEDVAGMVLTYFGIGFIIFALGPPAFRRKS